MNGKGPAGNRAAVAGALAALLLLALPSRPAAHEIPSDVTVLAFVHPDGERLRFLVRAPLEAMRDIEFPTRGPGYLDLSRAGPFLRRAATTWVAPYVAFYEEGERLQAPVLVAARVSLPSDRSFARYADALAHVTGPPLSAETELVWEQATLDALFEIPILSPGARFSIDSGLAHLGLVTRTVLRFLPADGPERAFSFTGDPGRVRLDPRWHETAQRFVESGVLQVLGGLDHLLFLLCLVIPFRRPGPLLRVMAAFVIAHSITLIAAGAGLAPDALWFPPLVATLIAASIVWVAIDNVVGPRLERRWALAFGFGLVHGFGFWLPLHDTLQFAGSHPVAALLSFNVGLEAGHALALLVAVPLLELLFRHGVAERIGTIVLSALVAHEAWHRMTGRGAELLQHEFRWPALDAGLLAAAMRWAMLLVAAGGIAWALGGRYRRAGRRDAGRAIDGLSPAGAPEGGRE